MFNEIIEVDQSLFLFLNQLRFDVLDPVMLFLSNKWVWIPLYLFLIFKIYQKNGFQGYVILLLVLFVFFLTEFITVGFMKPFFARLRPCHDPSLIDQLTLLGSCGGTYGFASSHAANTMGLALSVGLFMSKKIGSYLVAWSIVISYSRIYLGVHFPLDLVIGWIVGIMAAGVTFILATRLQIKVD